MIYNVTFTYHSNRTAYSLACESMLERALAHCGYEVYRMSRTCERDKVVFEVNLYECSLGVGDRHRLLIALGVGSQKVNAVFKKVEIERWESEQ